AAENAVQIGADRAAAAGFDGVADLAFGEGRLTGGRVRRPSRGRYQQDKDSDESGRPDHARSPRRWLTTGATPIALARGANNPSLRAETRDFCERDSAEFRVTARDRGW